MKKKRQNVRNPKCYTNSAIPCKKYFAFYNSTASENEFVKHFNQVAANFEIVVTVKFVKML